MIKCCETINCLRNYVLKYFGINDAIQCFNCCNCSLRNEEKDMTNEAILLIKCVEEAKESCGKEIIIETLMGLNKEILKGLRTVYFKTFGALKNYKKEDIEILMDKMIMDGYLYQETKYFYTVIKIGNISSLKEKNKSIIISKKVNNEDIESKNNILEIKDLEILTNEGRRLLEIFRNLRMEIAKEKCKSPYSIFTDKDLVELCLKMPINNDELKKIHIINNDEVINYGY
eukprot:jgi/Orpsp1_1/1187635/evm.model.d7180000059135.1